MQAAHWATRKPAFSITSREVSPKRSTIAVDRPFDVISIASLIILVTSRLACQRTGTSLAAETSLFFHLDQLVHGKFIIFN
jgi:hypothetical protein